jgi:hypothetical protein
LNDFAGGADGGEFDTPIDNTPVGGPAMALHLLTRLWADDCGAIISTEYLMLGTVVSLGGAAGLAEMRDSMNAEYKEFGNTIRDVRTHYSVPGASGCAGTRGGTIATDPGHSPGMLSLTATP